MQIKYRNNRLEADRGKLKRLINRVRGFYSIKTTYATIKGLKSCICLRKANLISGFVKIPMKSPFINEQLAYTGNLCLKFISLNF
ncbi:DDE-type integrase/transposase/recombinase [Legionella gratiana]|uniref:DDE-type integrase/transposase/recombinase n=1 Tax=Legionella gratiana TaxID=45066 RepID=UPI000731C864